MSASAAPRHDRADLIARCVIAGLFLGLAYRVGLNVLETGRFSGFLLLASELLVVVLTLTRRPATQVDRTWWVRVVTGVSIAGPTLLVPSENVVAAAEPVSLALSSLGLGIVIGGKVSLGRSLGLLPANRGIVCHGLYRLMRHPIYLGYLITHLGFLLGNPTVWNAVALVSADAALLVRAVLEERTLQPDPRYRRYLQVVPWRLVPGLY